MKSKVSSVIARLTVAASLGIALSIPAGMAAEMRAFSQACETALALSAAPAHLWPEAGVYLLGEDGYELHRPSENGFRCLVERNHPQSIIPICYDDSAKDAHLALALEKSRQWRQGKSFAEVDDFARAAVAAGEFGKAGPGVVYMVSGFNRIYNAAQGALLKVAPHVMFHAPDVSASDIGENMQAAFSNQGLPFINEPGQHAFIVSFVAQPSPMDTVEQACAGQIPQDLSLVPFPPQP